MGFNATTENPNEMMRENHNAHCSEYIIIYEDELYIVSTTPDLIYNINICLHDKYPHDPGGKDICQCQIKKYLEILYGNDDILFNDKLPTDLCISFKIIKLVIMKGNLNLLQDKNKYVHFNHLSKRENWINYTMKCYVHSF